MPEVDTNVLETLQVHPLVDEMQYVLPGAPLTEIFAAAAMPEMSTGLEVRILDGATPPCAKKKKGSGVTSAKRRSDDSLETKASVVQPPKTGCALQITPGKVLPVEFVHPATNTESALAS